jgi:hypothetical protein
VLCFILEKQSIREKQYIDFNSKETQQTNPEGSHRSRSVKEDSNNGQIDREWNGMSPLMEYAQNV